ncbi:MAG: HPt (histidine-containing phosphotransfer) domain-containing protein [Marivirga sp.]|jgi:HPt (histidine-containing phosphotransfer) domain-containing protein
MIDLSFLEKFTKGNTSKMKRYITMYLSIAPEIFERMNENITQENWTDLAINAHSIKPQTDFMGIKSLKNILIKIENGSKNGEYENLNALYQKAYEIHKKSEILLNDKLAQI